MPYFRCLLGDCKEAVIQEPGCFVVTDLKARTWLCCEGEETAADIVEMMRMQQLLHKYGFPSKGTKMVGVRCVKAELPTRLADK